MKFVEMPLWQSMALLNQNLRKLLMIKKIISLEVRLLTSGGSGNKITGPDREKVHEHIQMITVTTSHYSRAYSPHCRYTEIGMTQKILYKNYVD